jgi:FAD/FMN-containing dehydrogenase
MAAPAPLKSLLGSRCIDDPERLLRYEQPERGAPGRAACLLLPESEDEVGTILRVANAHDLKLTISAGRTGLVEAQRPEGESVLSLERLNHILDVNVEQRLATAEAGVSIDVLNAELEPLGLMWPMEMGSSSAATVGACVANGSAGANAVCYGTASHMCEAAWGWWGSGEATGPCSAEPWRAPRPTELAINSARIHPEWGLIGSQGVFGVITRVQLRLQSMPAQREAALIPVADMPAAMDVLAAARAEFGAGVEEFEFISNTAMNLVRLAKGAAFRLPFERDPDAAFYLLLQLKSVRPVSEEDLAARLYQLLSGELALPDEQIGYAPLKALKAIRHSITESSNLRIKQLGGGRLAFDTAAPTAVFGEYLKVLQATIDRDWPGLEFVAFGHAGVGGAHLHLLGSSDRPVAPDADALIRCVFDITQSFGGTYSAEHGVGTRWGDEFLRRTPSSELQRMLAAKRARDPHNVLNPRCLGMDRAL